ncbi:hypothetical protein R5R35_002673 [Gryllus longicercus]|uniref:Single domain-containing protein n=2 Tax=Gryllus longicercus TaxID=2509291 RepID=A0AAN9W1A0_9ORTH
MSLDPNKLYLKRHETGIKPDEREALVNKVQQPISSRRPHRAFEDTLSDTVAAMSRLSLLVVALLLATAAASISRMAVTECPHHPGQCQDPSTGEFHTAGSEWYHQGECQKFTCAFPEIIITGCPSIDVEPPCFVVDGDPALTYPACCPAGACSRPAHTLDENVIA